MFTPVGYLYLYQDTKQLSKTNFLAKHIPNKLQSASTHMGKLEAKYGADSSWYKVIFSLQLKHVFSTVWVFCTCSSKVNYECYSFYPVPHEKQANEKSRLPPPVQECCPTHLIKATVIQQLEKIGSYYTLSSYSSPASLSVQVSALLLSDRCKRIPS